MPLRIEFQTNIYFHHSVFGNNIKYCFEASIIIVAYNMIFLYLFNYSVV